LQIYTKKFGLKRKYETWRIFLKMISSKSLEKFKNLYFKHFRVRLTNKEATEKALMTLQVFRTILKNEYKN